MAPILEPKERGDLEGLTVRLPKPMWAELQEVADTEHYSRNEVIIRFLRYAIDAHRKEKAEMAKSRK